MQIGKTGINVEALAGIKKSEFYSKFEKVLGKEIGSAWKQFQKEAKKHK